MKITLLGLRGWTAQKSLERPVTGKLRTAQCYKPSVGLRRIGFWKAQSW